MFYIKQKDIVKITIVKAKIHFMLTYVMSAPNSLYPKSFITLITSYISGRGTHDAHLTDTVAALCTTVSSGGGSIMAPRLGI